MKTEIKILQKEYVKIVKRISIVSQNRFDNDIVIGYLLYERNFSPDYRFDSKQNEEKESFIIGPYPRQEDFPKDELDDLVLKIVCSKYPKSLLHNVLLFSTSDVAMIENWTNKPCEQLEINIAPDFSGYNLEMLSGRMFTQYRRKVNVYVDGSSEMIKNIILFGHCDLNRHDQIYDLLDNLVFL